MSDSIKIKSGTLGNRTSMPNLSVDELGYQKDNEALYIGTEQGNKKVGDAKWETRINALETKPETPGMFYAIYGETTGEEINEAYNAGKIVACKTGDGRILYLVDDWQTGKGFTFMSLGYESGTGNEVIIGAEVKGSKWYDINTTTLATKEQITEIEARLNALENASV